MSNVIFQEVSLIGFGTAQGNKRAMARLTELKRLGTRGKGGAMTRPTREEAKDEGCIIG